MMDSVHIPLFPLHTVLFPDGLLPLRIFEPRYLDMISWCLRNDSPFGVCLIREGREVGEVAKIYEVGTLAHIVDWNRRDDGLLGISVRGGQRFRVMTSAERADRLLEGDVSLIPEETPVPLPEEYHGMSSLIVQVLSQIGGLYREIPLSTEDSVWIGNRLAELLPMTFSQRQYLLELEDPVERLRCVDEMLTALSIRY